MRLSPNERSGKELLISTCVTEAAAAPDDVGPCDSHGQKISTGTCPVSQISTLSLCYSSARNYNVRSLGKARGPFIRWTFQPPFPSEGKLKLGSSWHLPPPKSSRLLDRGVYFCFVFSPEFNWVSSWVCVCFLMVPWRFPRKEGGIFLDTTVALIWSLPAIQFIGTLKVFTIILWSQNFLFSPPITLNWMWAAQGQGPGGVCIHSTSYLVGTE